MTSRFTGKWFDMCISAILGLGAALVGAASSSSAARSQSESADDQLALQERMHQESRRAFSPFLRSGRRAQRAYDFEMGLSDSGPSGYGGMEASPAFDFMLNQGLDSVNSSAAMRGKMNSGSTLQAMEQYRMGLASQESNNWLNRLQGMSNAGQSAAGMQGAANQNFATGGSAAMANYGNAQAAGAIGFGNAVAGGINTGASAYGYFNNLSQTPQTPPVVPTSPAGTGGLY